MGMFSKKKDAASKKKVIVNGEDVTSKPITKIKLTPRQMREELEKATGK